MEIKRNYLLTAEIDDPTFNKGWFPYYAHVYVVSLDNDYTGIIAPTLTNDLSYETDLNVNSVVVKQKVYVSVDSVADIIDTQASYYYDRDNRLLYVHFVNHNPKWFYSDVEIKINLIFGIYKSNYTNETFDGTLIGQQYSPRLEQTGKIATAKDDLYTGRQKFENSGITILNDDYRYVNYNLGSSVTQKKFGGLVKIKTFTGDDISSIDYDNDFSTIFQGRISQIIESNNIDFKLTDLRKQYDRKYPDTTFARISNNLNDGGLSEDPFIPQIWGKCFGVPGICLNKDADPIPSGGYKFMLCSNEYSIASDSVKAIYVKNVLLDITIPSVELIDNAYFLSIPTKHFSYFDEDDTLQYDGMDDVTVDIEGYLDETDTLISKGLTIIRYMLKNSYDIDFSSVYYQDTTAYTTKENESYKIGYYIEKPTEIYKQIEEVQKSLLGYLMIDDNLKIYWETDDEPDTFFTIEKHDILNPDWLPSITQDPEKALGSYRVGYNKKWGNGRYDYRVNDDNIDNALEQYNSREQKDFVTLLYDSDDVDDYIDRIEPFTIISEDTFNVEIMLTDDSALLRAGQWVTIPVDHPTKRILGNTKCQILKTNINIESMTKSLNLRIFDISNYLIDSEGFFLVDSENNRLYGWSA